MQLVFVLQSRKSDFATTCIGICIYLGDDGLLQSRKSDFATTPEKGKYVHQAKGAHHLSRKKHEQRADHIFCIL